MKKIKVLFIASEYATGMMPFASTIINILSKDERFDVRSIAVSSGKYSYKEKISSTNVVHVNYPSAKWKKVIYKIWPSSITRAIRQCEKSFNPDIIHLLTGDITLAFYVWTTSKRRYVWTVHDLQMHSKLKFTTNYKLFLLQFYQPITYKLFFHSVDLLCTSSMGQYESLQKMFANKRSFFTHFPSLVTTEIANGSNIPQELTNVSDYILFFGVENKYKGVDLLLQAFVKSNFAKNTYLVIAGKGHAKYKEEEHDHVIRLNRYFEDAEIKALFEKACLVVYPYRSATMSGVLSLAYYFKCRLLISDIPYFMENKARGVQVFKADDEASLLNKLNYIYNNINEIKTDDKAYSKYYSEDVISNDYYEMYSRILGRDGKE